MTRFLHSTGTASIRSINLKPSIGEWSLLTLLTKRSPTVQMSSSRRCFSKNECFLMIMCLLFQITWFAASSYERIFCLFSRDLRHLDILYKNAEGKLGVFFCIEITVEDEHTPYPRQEIIQGYFPRAMVFLVCVFP